MTVKEGTRKSTETAVADPSSQNPRVDIQRVLKKSTSDVSVSELAKKGFKQVKVLNKDLITRLIQEAVDRTIARRASTISKEERKRVIEQSKAEFQALAKVEQHLQESVKDKKREVDELKEKLAARETEIEQLRNEVEELRKSGSGVAMEGLMVSLLEKLKDQSSPGGEGISKLQDSIAGLADKISRIGAGGGGGAFDVADKDVILERLFARDDGESMESNVSEVKVKQAKAKGVKGSLNKLKELQQGGSKDGE